MCIRDRLDTIIKKLYESFAVGRITDERFDSLLADYEAEQKALQVLSLIHISRTLRCRMNRNTRSASTGVCAAAI